MNQNQFSNLEQNVKHLHEEKMAKGQRHYFTINADHQLDVLPQQTYWVNTHLKKIARLLDLKPSDFFVDIGCGEGYFTLPLSDQASFSIGLDFALSAIQLFKQQNGYNLEKIALSVASGDNIPLPTGYTNKLLCNHVMEHVIDDTAILHEIRRVVCPHGKILIGVPLAYSAQIQYILRLRRLIRPQSPLLQLEQAIPGQLVPDLIGVQHHIRFYSLHALFTLLQNNGFRVLETEGIGFGLPTFMRNKIRGSRLALRITTMLTTHFPSFGDGILVLAERLP